MLLTAALIASVATGSRAYPASDVEAKLSYDSATRTLNVTTKGKRNFRYVFNKGGAVSGIYDLDLAPDTNLVGDSFQGETTDRVIQWTYWNSRYLGRPHNSGDKDTRANVTMEGCFHGKHTCVALESPNSGNGQTLVFRSQITHWFYSELDRHGRPDFETTSRYEVLDDGSLKLERSVQRRTWVLTDVRVKTWDGKQWKESAPPKTTLDAVNLWPGSLTSYLENWIPLRRTALPMQRSKNGKFEGDGYKFWKPQELGGWVMAYGDKLAVAVVFGETETDRSPSKTHVVFNKQDLPQHNLNVLMPGIETDWPDRATLRQTLIFVVGEPSDVATRADRLRSAVPFPTMSIK